MAAYLETTVAHQSAKGLVVAPAGEEFVGDDGADAEGAQTKEGKKPQGTAVHGSSSI
jgi:hypothetical protein